MGNLNMFFDSKTLWKPRMWDIFIAYLPQRVVTSLYTTEKIWDRQISLKIRLFKKLRSEIYLVGLFVGIAVVNLVVHILKFM